MSIFKNKKEFEGWLTLGEEEQRKSMIAEIEEQRKLRRAKYEYMDQKELVGELEKKYPQFRWKRIPAIPLGIEWLKIQDGTLVSTKEENVPAEFRDAVKTLVILGNRL